jgi:hypothetical protein
MPGDESCWLAEDVDQALSLEDPTPAIVESALHPTAMCHACTEALNMFGAKELTKVPTSLEVYHVHVRHLLSPSGLTRVQKDLDCAGFQTASGYAPLQLTQS